MESSSSSNRTESAAEFVATVRKNHDVMMEWYNNNTSHELQPLREKYGPKYPESWKQVLNWNGWKDTRKAYVQYLQQHESSTTTASSSSIEIAPGQTNETSSAVTNPTTDNNYITPTNTTGTTTTNEESKNDTSAKPKRKSRWGSVSTTATAATTNTSNDSTTTDGTLTTTNDGNTIDTSNGSKRGRWGTTALSATETTTNTTSSSELEQLRSQLRSLNYKIDHVVEEANRIDALPHNHRERSVSPPPSYVYIETFYMWSEWNSWIPVVTKI